MEKYCQSCGRVFKDSDFKLCPYCGNSLSTRIGRQPIPRKLRHQVFQRDNYRCRECGATNKQTRLHVDHIVPVAKGGTNDLSNLQTLCEECNRAKYTDEWVGGVIDQINIESKYVENTKKVLCENHDDCIDESKSKDENPLSQGKDFIKSNPLLKYQNIDRWKHNICNNCNNRVPKRYWKCPYCGSSNLKIL